MSASGGRAGAHAGGDWLTRARAAASAPPLRPREPLYLDVDGRTSLVGSIEPALAGWLLAAGMPLRPMQFAAGDAAAGAVAKVVAGAVDFEIASGTDGWQVDASTAESLAAIAGWLRDAGLAGRWRNELLAVVDSEERAIAAIERSVVRVLGLTTYAVHLVGFAFDDRRVWVQQRAFDKATDPGLWDTLMGGQVAADETIETALRRETWEEAGLDVATLLDLRRGEPVTIRRPVAEGYMVEHLDVYTARLPEGVKPCNQDGEVEKFECLAAAVLEARLARGEFTLEASLILGRAR
ncbi:MAG: NUDIX domain-containing protein [Caldimonas sp.]